MKDIPVFSCPDGIATLILREVPFRGEGYILVRGVFGTPEGLLAECAGASPRGGCGAAVRRGRSGFFRLSGRHPHSRARAAGVAAARAGGGGAPVPVTEETAADWAREYNARFRAVPAAASCSPAEERARPRAARPCGLRTARCALPCWPRAASRWQWRRCCPARANAVRALAARCAGAGSAPDVRRGERARHAAGDRSLLPRREERVWFSI